eukprot:8651566-Pyramimonas_sp.AAC.1
MTKWRSAPLERFRLLALPEKAVPSPSDAAHFVEPGTGQGLTKHRARSVEPVRVLTAASPA